MTLFHPWYVQSFIDFCPLTQKVKTVKSGNLLSKDWADRVCMRCFPVMVTFCCLFNSYLKKVRKILHYWRGAKLKYDALCAPISISISSKRFYRTCFVLNFSGNRKKKTKFTNFRKVLYVSLCNKPVMTCLSWVSKRWGILRAP